MESPTVIGRVVTEFVMRVGGGGKIEKLSPLQSASILI